MAYMRALFDLEMHCACSSNKSISDCRFKTSRASFLPTMVEDGDWAGIIYRVLEREGEFTDAVVGTISAGGSVGAAPQLRYLPHARFDGLGLMAHLLREHGVAVNVPRRREAVPGWLTRLALLWRHGRNPP